jgi:hypothetical protein
MKPETVEEIQQKEKVIVPPLQILPRPLSTLHCTFFFGGTVLASPECTDEELLYFYEKITHRLAQSGFITADDASNHTFNTPNVHLPDDYWFHVKEFKVFPPRGKYLIVAELQASLAYHHLWNDIHDIARNEMAQWAHRRGTTTTTKSVIHAFMNTPSQKHITRWIPHITVANIQHAMDGKRVEEKILRTVLKSLSDDHYDNTYADTIENMKCHSISMGGPIPQLKHNRDPEEAEEEKEEKKVLNWEYQFQYVRRGSQKELEWDDDIWVQPHEPDPFGYVRKKWLRKKRRWIARGLLDPDDDDENDDDTKSLDEATKKKKNDDDDDDDQDYAESDMMDDQDDDDMIDDDDELYEDHPQRHILNVFRKQAKHSTTSKTTTTTTAKQRTRLR